MADSKLRFYYGCMNSAKTLQLLTTAFSFENRNIPFLCIKPSTDSRCDENVIKSRVGLERECIVVYPHQNIYELIKIYLEACDAVFQNKLKWILVDEAQFLTEKQIDELSDIVDYFNINVSCYGLRTDFKTKSFPGSMRLLEIADTITEVKSPCSCGTHTSVNARLGDDGKLITDGEQIMVGDEEYVALCRKCYKERFKKESKK